MPSLHVVGEIPAVVVGIFVDHDLVAVPVPVVAIGEIKRGNAEVEAAKPEAAGAASADAPDVAAAEAAGEAAMLPGMIEVEAGVVASSVVSNPLAVVVDVRSFGMACPGRRTPGAAGSARERAMGRRADHV